MPNKIQRMFDCQSRLWVIEARVGELGRQLREHPGDERLRQHYSHANREALGLSCQLVRLAAEA